MRLLLLLRVAAETHPVVLRVAAERLLLLFVLVAAESHPVVLLVAAETPAVALAVAAEAPEHVPVTDGAAVATSEAPAHVPVTDGSQKARWLRHGHPVVRCFGALSVAERVVPAVAGHGACCC